MATVLVGLNVSTSAAQGADPVADARRAEHLGFDFVSASDHPCGTAPTFETWTMLSWIAASTSRIKVATRVLGVPYRPPPIVAKMAETLDRLSRGRLILGMGGGYSDDEFRAFGLRVPTSREKVEGLEEAIHITRGLWTEPSFTFEGTHYRSRDADLEPKPTRHIPIWVGTYGSRSLAVTGRVADGWIPTFGMAPPSEIPAMRDRIFAAAEGAGRDPGDIELVYNVDVRVDQGTGGPDDVITGPPAAITERLGTFLELGFTGLNLIPIGSDVGAQIEVLGAEVLPQIRSAA